MTRVLYRRAAALAILYVLFIFPASPWSLDLLGFAHAPYEPLLLLLLARLLPARVWAGLRPVLAMALAFIMVIKVANIVALQGFDRPFAPLADLPLIPIALGTLGMNNPLLAAAAVTGVAAVVGGIAWAAWWALGVLGAFAQVPAWRQVSAALAAATVALSFVRISDPPRPAADAATSRLIREQAEALVRDVKDLDEFRMLLDRPGPTPNPRTLAGLKGVDVLVIFIESYGRSALERAPYEQVVRPALGDATRALMGAGFHASSAWLTSTTFGGESWLAHSTVMSGLPVTSDARYRALVGSERPTLVADFKHAGWRTAVVMAEITGPWPEGKFFGFDATYAAADLGYAGPAFGYMTMSDQYVLHAFNQRELAKSDRSPLMAEIALISSHIPWAPLPKMVPWSDIGDGAIFATARTTEAARDVWSVPGGVELAYAHSLEYVLRTVTSFITTYGRDNTLVILMGDHQPMGFIAGEGAGRQVPVHVIARDEKLLRALDGGAWTGGMTPAADGPVTPMEALRGRILSAFTPQE